MRKLKLIEHISLEGVIQVSGGPGEDGDSTKAMPSGIILSNYKVAGPLRTP